MRPEGTREATTSAGDNRDSAGTRRDHAADQRDDAAEQRDLTAERRDAAAVGRDSVGDRRDLIACERDIAGSRRDGAAERRDVAASRRDLAGGLRDEAADLRDKADEHYESQHAKRMTKTDLTRSWAARQEAAADRVRAAQDRRAAAGERTFAEQDRGTALEDRATAIADRAAGAGERSYAVGDRDIAMADRGDGAAERGHAGADRDTALSDRGAASRDRHNASVDELTGAYRRAPGMAELRREIARVQRTCEPLTLVFLDVDHLKVVNDSLGHPAGDQLLRDVATIVKAELRSHDLLIRYGGDEFICVAPGLELSDLVARLKHVNVALEISATPGTVSVGLAELQPLDTAEDLVARADAALYQTRRELRGTIAPER